MVVEQIIRFICPSCPRQKIALKGQLLLDGKPGCCGRDMVRA